MITFCNDIIYYGYSTETFTFLSLNFTEILQLKYTLDYNFVYILNEMCYLN